MSRFEHISLTGVLCMEKKEEKKKKEKNHKSKVGTEAKIGSFDNHSEVAVLKSHRKYRSLILQALDSCTIIGTRENV